MKKVIGLLILIIVLVSVSGCTQQTKTAPVTTTVPTTVAATEVTTVATAVPTTEVPVATTEVATNETVDANATAPAETTMVPTVTPTMSMTPSTKVTLIHIANNTFTPSVLMVLPGTGITWENDDKVVHSVKAIGDSQGMFNSGNIVSGSRWGYTFSEKEGTYQYADGYNMNVTGTIIIQSGEALYGNPATSATAIPTTTS